ncbi:MAG: DnaJ C-terminal domain-containing protein [Paracoccus sp. (in: a-proteobacteria)]|nr:DnaJ C-terminal domain-containing protein [Paracoccus sp. (in: a-proteobacteria)]
MAQDPYAALGVGKTATEAEIKKAYRRIAKTDHPDLNPDPTAAERFKAAAAAYDLLRDPEKRARFDAGEIDAQGQERPQRRYYRDFAQGAENPYADGAGFGAGFREGDAFADVFSDLFGARAQARAGHTGRAGRAGGHQTGGDQYDPRDGGGFSMRGQDLRFTLAVDFLTAVNGGTTRITLPDGATLDVRIPAGAHDGQTIRLRGKGGAGLGDGGPGDAYLTLNVEEHADFRREGDDIFVTLPVSLPEAVLGGKVPVPTVDGAVNLTVPAGASSGRRLRLRGKGAPRPGGGRGDMYAELRIVMPEQIDEGLAAFMREWRAGHDYDPRKGGR